MWFNNVIHLSETTFDNDKFPSLDMSFFPKFATKLIGARARFHTSIKKLELQFKIVIHIGELELFNTWSIQF